MKTNIAMILDNSFRPDLRVLKEAESLVQAGYRVTIYAWDQDLYIERPNHEVVKGVNVKRIRVPTARQLGLKQIPNYFKFLYKTIRVALNDDFDLIHCHDLPSLPIGVVLKILRKNKLIYDAHEIYWIMESKKYPVFVLKLIKYFEIVLLKSVDALITVGNIRLNYYRNYYEKDISVIGNWYDLQQATKEKGKELRQELGIPLDAFVISYAGTLSRARSPEVIIESSKQLWKLNSPVHWVIAGSGPQEQLLEEAAKSDPTLHYIGWLDDLSGLYSASDALIYLMNTSHPYADYNSPNNLFLSIAWALPLITISKGEIGVTLSPNENGILLNDITPNIIVQEVIELYTDKVLYQRIVTNLIKLQESYNWQIAAKRLVTLYQELLPFS
jgi:glycosyltransferase involved in cell wall biosynthesis